MNGGNEPTEELIVSIAVGRHLALAPVAFAVTEGPAHALVYANALFRKLQSADLIRLGPSNGDTTSSTAANLAPLLTDALQRDLPIRDAVVEPPAGQPVRWSCSVWPVSDSSDAVGKLVIEVRDIELIEAVKERQRSIAEQLLLGALREQDAAADAARTSEDAQFLAGTSRELSLSLDELATRETVRRLALPRPGTWCIVDVVESSGAIHRLAVIHPDPAKQQLARLLEEPWPAEATEPGEPGPIQHVDQPTVVTGDSGAALIDAAHGEAKLRVLREIGFGSLLIVPLVVRARVQGAITFVSREGDPPFSSREIALAADVAARCAMALDNARLYREADALRLAAEAANESKSHFLGTMSHELRTPLNIIGGFVELIELGIEGPVTDRQLVALARIKASQKHLLKMITEILNFVRIESGRMEYRFGHTSIPHAMADVIDMLDAAAKEKGLTLLTQARDPGDDDLIAWADPERVRQILVNLLMNAVKYTPAGGTITASCCVAGETIVARIADSGAGVPDDRVESIFEPFVQLTAGFTNRRGGVGLGLPISRDLARAMNGDVTLEPNTGSGASFTLTLPRAPRDATA
jgi:signal transduction histidine kinase